MAATSPKACEKSKYLRALKEKLKALQGQIRSLEGEQCTAEFVSGVECEHCRKYRNRQPERELVNLTRPPGLLQECAQEAENEPGVSMESAAKATKRKLSPLQEGRDGEKSKQKRTLTMPSTAHIKDEPIEETPVQHGGGGDGPKIPQRRSNPRWMKGGRHKCPFCTYSASTEHALNSHVSRQHGSDYKCDACDFQTGQSAVLEGHINFKHLNAGYMYV